MKDIYIDKLKSGVLPKYLVTIAYGKRAVDSLRENEHILSVSGSICASTTAVDIMHGGLRIPFKPTLLEVPVIKKEIAPITREVVSTSATISLSGITNIDPDFLITNNGSLGIVVRIDLYVDGMTVDELQPILIGQPEGQAEYNTITKSIKFTVIEGTEIDNTNYPPGELSLDASIFSSIPPAVNGRFKRRVILGRAPFPVTCPQVDDGHTFYVADHPILLEKNSSFYIGSATGDITDAYSIVSIPFPSGKKSALGKTGFMSAIFFEKKQTLDLPYILVNNIVGLSATNNPVLTLLNQYSNYSLTKNSKSLLQNMDFYPSILTQGQGTSFGIFNDRVLLQTDYFCGFDAGRIEMYDLAGLETGIRLDYASNILDSTSVNSEETPDDSVLNVIEIGWQRNIFSYNDFDLTKHTYVLSKESATGELKRKLTFSEEKYGKKYKRMEFPDIYARSTARPLIIDRVAKKILSNNYKQRRLYNFMVKFWPGVDLQLNSIVTVNYPKFNLINQRVRIITKKYLPYCMDIGVMIED